MIPTTSLAVVQIFFISIIALGLLIKTGNSWDTLVLYSLWFVFAQPIACNFIILIGLMTDAEAEAELSAERAWWEKRVLRPGGIMAILLFQGYSLLPIWTDDALSLTSFAWIHFSMAIVLQLICMAVGTVFARRRENCRDAS